MTQTVIIGGGPAGMAAAIAAARRGEDTLLVERLDRVGKKLLATGNGRCNLMNRSALAYPGGETFARQVLARPPAGLVVLDIRTPEEFRDGHLPGARNLDFFAPDFRQQLEALAREDVPILLYCRSGNRSGQAMRLLRQWGRDDVLHLADGFRSWRAAGLPEE